MIWSISIFTRKISVRYLDFYKRQWISTILFCWNIFTGTFRITILTTEMLSKNFLLSPTVYVHSLQANMFFWPALTFLVIHALFNTIQYKICNLRSLHLCDKVKNHKEMRHCDVMEIEFRIWFIRSKTLHPYHSQSKNRNWCFTFEEARIYILFDYVAVSMKFLYYYKFLFKRLNSQSVNAE